MSSSQRAQIAENWSGELVPIATSQPIVDTLAQRLFGQNLRTVADQASASELIHYSIEYARTITYRNTTANWSSAVLNKVDDISQEVGITVLNRFQEYSRTEHFSKVLNSIARDRMYSVFRREEHGRYLYKYLQPRERNLALSQLEDRQPLAAEIAQTEEILAMLPLVRKNLTEKHQEVLNLYDQHLSYREIADRLQIPIMTVKSRLGRARHAIATWFGLDT